MKSPTKEIHAAARATIKHRRLRATLKADGFTDQEIDEVFHFAQIVEPSGNVVVVREAKLPELRGIMDRLFRGKRDEQD